MNVKFITIFLALLFTCGIFAQSSNAVRLPDQVYVKESESNALNMNFYSNNKFPPVPFWISAVPVGAVPGLVGFSDYATNGNTINQIIVKGDTVVVAFIYVDSAEAQNANGGNTVRMAYNYSFNGGATWESSIRVDIGTFKCRWPDMSIVTTPGGRTLAGTGRVYGDPGNPTQRAGGVMLEPAFGAGSAARYTVPTTGQAGNTDYFTDQMVNGKLAGVWQRNDTIYSQYFDPTISTPAYGSRNFVYKVTATNFVASYDVYASRNSNTIYTFYNFINENPNFGGLIPYSIFRYQKSTDQGATWTAASPVLANYVVQGDSMRAYWHQDVAFKPGTDDPYLVFSTQPTVLYGNWDPGGSLLDSNRRGYNILIWSQNLNSGTPVRVASYQNIDVLADTNKFKLVTRIRTIQAVQVIAMQVNSSILSHPTIGFSQDGSTIHVAFSVAQTDTSSEMFNYFDVYTTKSTNGGLNWSTPVNITNTSNQDEMYPVISKTGNTATFAAVSYHSTAVPGCQGFGRQSTIESQIIAPVYQCNSFNVIGIKEIGSEIPKEYSLQQNYPNPFNPVTKIRFSMPIKANVTMNVYDITGKLVKTILNNAAVNAGIKEIEFDATELASGVYFYSLISNEFRDTKKMILVK